MAKIAKVSFEVWGLRSKLPRSTNYCELGGQDCLDLVFVSYYVNIAYETTICERWGQVKGCLGKSLSVNTEVKSSRLNSWVMSHDCHVKSYYKYVSKIWSTAIT